MRPNKLLNYLYNITTQCSGNFKKLVFLRDGELWHKIALILHAVEREAMKVRVNAHSQKSLPGRTIVLKTT